MATLDVTLVQAAGLRLAHGHRPSVVAQMRMLSFASLDSPAPRCLEYEPHSSTQLRTQKQANACERVKFGQRCVSCSAPLVTKLTDETVKTSNPVFNQSFVLPVKDAATCQLEVTLWNAGESALQPTAHN